MGRIFTALIAQVREKKSKKYLLMLAILTTILPFQNCGQFAALKIGANQSGSIGDLATQKLMGVRRISNFEYRSSLEHMLRYQYGTHGQEPNYGADFGTGVFNNFQSTFQQLPQDRPSKKMGSEQTAFDVSLVRFSAYVDIANVLASDTAQSVDRLRLFIGSCVVSQEITTSVADQTCATGLIKELGTVAFRQPPTSDEISDLLKNVGTWRVLIARIWMHPRFLVHYERGGTKIPGTNTYQLTAYELEGKLAGLLWKSVPDADGLKAAASGSVLTPTGLKAEIKRMLDSPKAESAMWNFYQQWFAMSRIPGDYRSGDFFQRFVGPDLSALLTDANADHLNGLQPFVLQDGRDFLRYVTFTQKGTLADVFRSPAIFTKNPILAKIYGVSPRANDTDPPIMDTTGRFKGILTRPVITQQAPSVDSEINHILRGVFLLINITGSEMGPPANFADQEVAAKLVPRAASTRTEVTIKTSLSQCTGCHSQINPAGYALGNYDSLGRFQTVETRIKRGYFDNSTNQYVPELTQVNPVDASTVLKLGDKVYDIQGASGLVDALIDSGKLHEGFTKYYMQYAMGRVATSTDDIALSEAMKTNLKTKSIRDTLEAFAMDPGFARAQAP